MAAVVVTVTVDPKNLIRPPAVRRRCGINFFFFHKNLKNIWKTQNIVKYWKNERKRDTVKIWMADILSDTFDILTDTNEILKISLDMGRYFQISISNHYAPIYRTDIGRYFKPWLWLTTNGCIQSKSNLTLHGANRNMGLTLMRLVLITKMTAMNSSSYFCSKKLTSISNTCEEWCTAVTCSSCKHDLDCSEKQAKISC